MARALGREAEAMTLDAALANFDALLAAEPAVVDDADRELREALGLRAPHG